MARPRSTAGSTFSPPPAAVPTPVLVDRMPSGDDSDEATGLLSKNVDGMGSPSAWLPTTELLLEMLPGSTGQSIHLPRFPAAAMKPLASVTARVDDAVRISGATSSDDAECLQGPDSDKFMREQDERFNSIFSCNVPHAETHEVVWSTRKLIPLATAHPLLSYAALWSRNVGQEPPTDRQIVTFRRDVTLIRWSFDHALELASKSIGDLRSAM